MVGCNAIESLKGMLTRVKPELLEPVYIRGAPRVEDLKKVEELAIAIEKTTGR